MYFLSSAISQACLEFQSLIHLTINSLGCGINDNCNHDQFCTDVGFDEATFFLIFKCSFMRKCLFKFKCGQKVAEVFLDSGQKYFGEINEGRIGRMKCFCLIKIFDYNKHLQASCLTATGCLTLQITLTCRNMKVWSDATKKPAHNNNNKIEIEIER